MQFIGYVVYGIGVLLTLSWIVGIRQHTVHGTPPMKPSINQTMLFVVCLVLVPAMSLSPLHLLWMFPASWILGLFSLAMPFALLSIPGQVFYRLTCLGMDTELAERNRNRIEKLRELTDAESITVEQARDKLIERGEW